jgi:hypothetical protein
VFWHPEKQIKTLVHGDDYVSSGTTDSMNWLETELTKAYEIKTQKAVGKGVGYQSEGKVLNRILRINEDGWENEGRSSTCSTGCRTVGAQG